MDRELVIEKQTVVVKNGRITGMGNADTIKYSKEAMVVDAGGKFLIPGLAEMHAHVPPLDDLEPMKEVLLLFAVNGVTTIRGMLGHPRHLELRSRIKTGKIIGPRFYTSGPSFNGQSVKTETDAVELVRKQKLEGYDFLKLHPGLTKATFAAMEKTAKEVNIPYAGHVSFDVGIWRAIDAGYATIDHLDGFIEGMVPGIDTIKEQQTGLFGMFIAKQADTTQISRLMKALREHNIWVVPTQSLAERWFAPIQADDLLKAPEMKYMKPDILNNWAQSKRNLMNNARYNSTEINSFIKLRRRLIYECIKNNVKLLLGSDAPQIFNVPGFSLHHELKYMVDAGLTPYEALKTGTVNVASFYNHSGEMGIIREGAVSDLVLLNGNPLKDITQTGNIEGVMLGKLWLSKEYITRELKKLVKQ
jgi:imidazolonepropionase-like amidohydrolase